MLLYKCYIKNKLIYLIFNLIEYLLKNSNLKFYFKKIFLEINFNLKK